MRVWAIALFAIVVGTPILGKDIFTRLMGDSVATASDAAELLYYSIKAIFTGQETDIDPQERQEMERLLKERGLMDEIGNKPLRRGTLARALMEHFQLTKSFLTRLLGFESLYYQDAVKLGLFDDNLGADANLTTRELLRAYLKAESLRNK
ncbi:MAG: hypothetical protein NZM25_02360 [Leptospiraceae bacterium]|nr:hypothetical protein [Leptospiraceae bacterium]MDW8307687.1 hypothetical protein [Leptospiraceae bacterium]